MNRIKKCIIPTVCGLVNILLLIGCSNKSQQPVARTFPAIDVPVIYTDPQTRAEYLAMHFWDKFDFNDTAYVESSTLISEQAIVDYISALPYASYNVIYKGIKHTLDQASQNKAMYIYFYTVMSHYLFDNMDSPLRNYEFYIPVLEHMLESEHLDERRKARPRVLLGQLQKNRPGQQATEIHYTTFAGAKKTLSDVQTDYTIVMFHSLDCDFCKDLMAVMNASEIISTMISQKKLTVLAIYPGSELDEWREYQKGIPASWIKGYDHDLEIEGKETYAMWSIPALYLIDKDRMVIMKESPFNYIEFYLGNILNPPAAIDPTEAAQPVAN